jgi:uncharacterized protein YraI
MNRCLPGLLALSWLVMQTGPSACAQNEALARADRVNVRSRPSLKAGEVVTQLTRGQRVLVFEEGLPGLLAGEPVTEWVRIELPAGTRVWVSAEYVHPVSNEVSTRLLNVRAGPGEDFAVLGRVGRGVKLSVLGSTNGWLEVQAPRGLSGFVAAHLLEPVPPAAVPAAAPPAETPAAPQEPAPVEKAPESAPPSSPPSSPAAVPAPEASTPPPAPAGSSPEPATGPEARSEPITPAVADVASPQPGAPATQSEPVSPPRRVVQREGEVRRTWSIQAPTAFELRATDTGRRLNYLWVEADGPDLSGLHRRRVRVTGEEFLEPGWATPLIRVEQIRLTQ